LCRTTTTATTTTTTTATTTATITGEDKISIHISVFKLNIECNF